MYKVSIFSINNNHDNRVIVLREPKTIYEILKSCDISLNNASCGGNHSCGKCVVSVKGNTSTCSGEEYTLLQNSGYTKDNIYGTPRLACMCKILGDSEIYYSNTDFDELFLNDKLEHIHTKPTRVGIAIDIGTTTLEISFYNLDTCERLIVKRTLNSQRIFGADVLSRIEHANREGYSIGHETIIKDIYDSILSISKTMSISLETIESIVITGNTTMLHFLTNLNPSGIGVYPFTPMSLFGYEIKGNKLFPYLSDTSTIYISSCIGPYIGGDITCGILYTDMLSSNKVNLLIDVGTNGEIALSKDGYIYCCSTAAGPAFEGGEISNGSIAVSGAIDRVWLEDNKIQYSTINNTNPKGICGTGIISAIETLLEAGMIDSSGRIKETGHKYCDYIFKIEKQLAVYIVKKGVFLTQQDIRNVQLAKAAIAAGISTLLNETETDIEDVQSLYLSGGFGSGINATSAAAIGLIPKQLVDRVQSIGNSALLGAERILLNNDKEKMKEISEFSTEISLSSNSYFMDQYINNMSFMRYL